MLADLALLLHAAVAATEELFRLFEFRKLYRREIGITGFHLLASVLFDKSISIWIRGRRLAEIIEELGVHTAIP